jgi:hypothetical protein
MRRAGSRQEIVDGDGSAHGEDRGPVARFVSLDPAIAPAERRARVGDRLSEDLEPPPSHVDDPVVGDPRAGVEAALVPPVEANRDADTSTTSAAVPGWSP